ncbi:MAG TPA: hypothetical protein VG308_13825 [Stellaceae bacterium]|nr:hypothetical protein [Stellaceae bacterium]
MRDDELRGAILQRFFDYRHRGILQLTDILDVGYPAEPLLVASVCERLAQAGLIEWKTSKSMAAVGGIGRITAAGVDVVEGHRDPPNTPMLRGHVLSGGGTTNIQAGGGVSATGRLPIDRALKAVDQSNASDADKSLAKSLITELGTNPLACSVLGTLFAGGR